MQPFAQKLTFAASTNENKQLRELKKYKIPPSFSKSWDEDKVVDNLFVEAGIRGAI